MCFQLRHISNEEDNRLQVVLKLELFEIAATMAFAKPSPLEKRICDCSEKEKEVTNALQTLRIKGPCKLQNSVLKWKEDDGLLYFQGKVYIPNSASLCNDVIKSCHDAPMAGHPGKHTTLELISQ